MMSEKLYLHTVVFDMWDRTCDSLSNSKASLLTSWQENNSDNIFSFFVSMY